MLVIYFWVYLQNLTLHYCQSLCQTACGFSPVRNDKLPVARNISQCLVRARCQLSDNRQNPNVCVHSLLNVNHSLSNLSQQDIKNPYIALYIFLATQKKNFNFLYLKRTFHLSVTASPWPYISSKLNKPLEMVLSFLIAPLSPKD